MMPSAAARRLSALVFCALARAAEVACARQCAAGANCSACAREAPFVRDHGWAQVTRVRPRCMVESGPHRFQRFADAYAEGRSAGWPLDHGLPAYDFFPDGADAEREWPYG